MTVIGMGDVWKTSYAFTRAREGGTVDDPHDPGGLTVSGLILADLQHFSRAATEQDLLDMTEDVKEAVYIAEYWLPVAGWQLPHAVALMTFDHGVNCGVGDSAMVLQRLLKVTPDGHIGRLTLAAANAVGAPAMASLLAAIRDGQDADYRHKANARYFLHGWESRLAMRFDAAEALL